MGLRALLLRKIMAEDRFVMLFLTLLIAVPVKDKGDTVVGWVLGIWVCLQCIVLILSVPVVERELRKRFDRNGNVRV